MPFALLCNLMHGSNPNFQLQLSIGRASWTEDPLTVRYPGTLEFSITPYLISCFYKDTSSLRHPTNVALAARVDSVALYDVPMKKQPLHPRWGKNPYSESTNPRRFFYLPAMSNSVFSILI